MQDLLADPARANRDLGPDAAARRLSGLAIGLPFLMADIGFTGLYFGSTLAHPGQVTSSLLWLACLGLPVAPLAAVLLGSAATALAVRSRDRPLIAIGLGVTGLGAAGIWVLSAAALTG